IAKQIVERANKSIGEFGPIFGALGMLDTTDPEQMKANMQKLKDDNPTAVAQRAALREAIDFKSYEFNCHGVELNQRYKSGAVVADGAMPKYKRDAELYHQPTTWPGAKLPHAFVYHGTETHSTLDLIGKGSFTLITGIGGEGWVKAAAALSKSRGLTIATRVIGPGRDYEDHFGDWAKLREISEAGCLLVRPDGIVAYRHNDAAKDAKKSLDDALTHILGLN
ncbi:MAG: 2,4-dichlorophenol 6-monooxygenase, partial [Rhizobiaceae bacterium]